MNAKVKIKNNMSETGALKLWIPFIIFFCISVISGTITIKFWGKPSLLGISIKDGRLIPVCFFLKPVSLIASSFIVHMIKNENVLVWILKGLVTALALIDAILLFLLLLIFLLLIGDHGSLGVGPT